MTKLLVITTEHYINQQFVCLNALISGTSSRILGIIFTCDNPIYEEGFKFHAKTLGSRVKPRGIANISTYMTQGSVDYRIIF